MDSVKSLRELLLSLLLAALPANGRIHSSSGLCLFDVRVLETQSLM